MRTTILFIAIFALNVPGALVLAASTENDPDRKNLRVARAYRDSNGGMYVQFTNHLQIAIPAFVADGQSFYCVENRCDQLAEKRLPSSGKDLDMNFEAADGSAGRITILSASGSYTVTCSDSESKELKAISGSDIFKLNKSFQEGSIVLHSLPEDMRVSEYGLKVGDKFIYVDAAKKSHLYESMKFYVGSQDAMLEVPIKTAARMGDGGTTYITLNDGRILYSPTASRKDDAPTFDKVPAVKLSPYETARLRAAVAKTSKSAAAPEAKRHSPCPAPIQSAPSSPPAPATISR